MHPLEIARNYPPPGAVQPGQKAVVVIAGLAVLVLLGFLSDQEKRDDLAQEQLALNVALGAIRDTDDHLTRELESTELVHDGVMAEIVSLLQEHKIVSLLQEHKNSLEGERKLREANLFLESHLETWSEYHKWLSLSINFIHNQQKSRCFFFYQVSLDMFTKRKRNPIFSKSRPMVIQGIDKNKVRANRVTHEVLKDGDKIEWTSIDTQLDKARAAKQNWDLVLDRFTKKSGKRGKTPTYLAIVSRALGQCGKV